VEKIKVQIIENIWLSRMAKEASMRKDVKNEG
jgi:hypothetical protein